MLIPSSLDLNYPWFGLRDSIQTDSASGKSLVPLHGVPQPFVLPMRSRYFAGIKRNERTMLECTEVKL
jgi:hypothetical protein